MLRDIFDEADLDGSGHLDMDELTVSLQELVLLELTLWCCRNC